MHRQACDLNTARCRKRNNWRMNIVVKWIFGAFSEILPQLVQGLKHNNGWTEKLSPSGDSGGAAGLKCFACQQRWRIDTPLFTLLFWTVNSHAEEERTDKSNGKFSSCQCSSTFESWIWFCTVKNFSTRSSWLILLIPTWTGFRNKMKRLDIAANPIVWPRPSHKLSAA